MKKRKSRWYMSKNERQEEIEKLAELRERRAVRGPSGVSVRSLMRAQSSGWVAPKPTKDAVRKHEVRRVEIQRAENRKRFGL